MMRSRLTRRRPRFGGNSWLLLLILVVLGLSIWVMTPSGSSVLDMQRGNLGLRLGLDLQGGTHVVYRGVFSDNVPNAEKDFDMDAAVNSIKRRVDSFGVVEPVIRRLGSDSVDIQLPGVSANETLELIGETAFLEFREVEMNGTEVVRLSDYTGGSRADYFDNSDSGVTDTPINRLFVGADGLPAVFIMESEGGLNYFDAKGNAIDSGSIDPTLDTALSWMPAVGEADGAKRVLTGAYLKEAHPYYPQAEDIGAEISVSIEWNATGTDLFDEITKRIKAKGEYGDVQRALGIFLDNELLSAPQVFPETMGGDASYGSSASITGDFDAKEARRLAIQLTSGALPMPMEISYGPKSVSATLGADFAHRAFIAVLVGLLVVGLFMILYYRLPGVVAAVALLIYAVIVLAIYKAIPVTLTLAGIAGFIVSLGMAVDANVLIFERMKEELRAGRTLKAAVDTGFNRAWPAIRDSNITTFIACGILYWFGSSIPTATVVMGFAVTLFFGVLVSMFSAIVISKTLLMLLAGGRFAKRIPLFGVEARAEATDV
ncbi:MAG: protein translocase subunit SecD [Dehalococcoidia bacterium]|nr:protein translocase subunit SecD [Dehalococcoidia bacterium]